jgi:hypothetical protein
MNMVWVDDVPFFNKTLGKPSAFNLPSWWWVHKKVSLESGREPYPGSEVGPHLKQYLEELERI